MRQSMCRRHYGHNQLLILDEVDHVIESAVLPSGVLICQRLKKRFSVCLKGAHINVEPTKLDHLYLNSTTRHAYT